MLKLSFLVAAWEEADHIDAFLRSYLKLTYPNLELILCAGGPDGTLEKAKKYENASIKIIKQEPGEGKQRALRKTFHFATGDIVVLADADGLLNDAALMALIEPLVKKEEGVTSGGCMPLEETLTQPFIFYQYAMQNQDINRTFRKKYLLALLGSNAAILYEVLKKVGAFNEDVAIGEDSFLAKKIVMHGYRIRYMPESIVETEYPATLAQFRRQKERWVRTAIMQNLRSGFRKRLIKPFLPLVIGVGFLALLLIGLFFSRQLLIVWAILTAWYFLRRARYLRSFGRSTNRSVPRSSYFSIPLYAINESIAIILGLLQLLSGSQDRW